MNPSDPHTPPSDDTASRQAGFLQVLAAVFWSFFGIRKKAAGERDLVSIKPLHLIVAAVLGAAILVGTLVLLVSYITRKG
jgi:ABC-type Zn2+ transport system substrate-binding protein/surface adhesin